jgi:Flp pilus assembly pilin Flp
MFLLKKRRRGRARKARGQGITEYGAMLAFVAVLVAMCFSIANGKLTSSVSAAFSAIAGRLNALSSYVNATS